MRQFAKLFGPADDQVLVTREYNAAGAPVVRVSCLFDEALYTAEAVFPDNAPGRLLANLRFSNMTEERARRIIEGHDSVAVKGTLQ